MAPKCFVKWKVSWRYTILVSFIFIAFAVLKLYIFNVSCNSKKGHFGLILGAFSCITSPNQVRFAQNFHQRCRVKQSITYVTVFDRFLKLFRNGPKKPILGFFFRGFPSTPPEPLCATPKFFVKCKVSWRYTIVPSFIFITFLVLKLYIFKSSPSSKKGHFGLLLGGFLDITRPNHVGFVPNFHQQCSAMQSITYVTVCNIILKIRKMEPKNPFLGVFSKVFQPRPPNHLAPRPNLLSNERSHGDTQS